MIHEIVKADNPYRVFPYAGGIPLGRPIPVKKHPDGSYECLICGATYQEWHVCKEVKPAPEQPVMPEGLGPHQKDYKPGAWDDYTMAELGYWVHLYTIRASHRNNKEKAKKDLHDARNYLEIMKSKLDFEEKRILA